MAVYSSYEDALYGARAFKNYVYSNAYSGFSAFRSGSSIPSDFGTQFPSINKITSGERHIQFAIKINSCASDDEGEFGAMLVV